MTVPQECGGRTLSIARMLAYGSPIAASYLMFMPIGIVLQGIYAKHFGLALTAIASVFFIARVFDAVSDPVIGYLADKTRANGTSRRWWVLAGGIGLFVCSYNLYVPPQPVGVSYFMFWSLAFYLAWTVLDVAHLAWGSELTRDPTTRTRLFTVRGAMVYAGAIAFYVLPMLPIFETTEFTPEILKFAVVLSGCIMLPALVLSSRLVPNGEYIRSHHQESFSILFRAVLANKPFLIYVAIYMLTGIGGGVWISLTFIVFDSFYGIGTHIALLYSLGSVVGVAGLPLWLWASKKVGKRRCWGIAQLMNLVCFSIPLFVTPGVDALVPLLISTVGIFFSEGCRLSVLPSLLADIVDYGTWKFGSDRAATYFSLNTLMQKISIGVGAGSGLMVLGWLNFDPTTVIVGAESARFAVVVAFCLLPASVISISLLFLSGMQFSERHSRIVSNRLALRIRRDAQT